MNEFRVSDSDKYAFKPKVIVAEICQIYINLSHSDEFCAAVSADGRSYSPELFPRAENILRRIHQPFDKIQAFYDLSKKVAVSLLAPFHKCVITDLYFHSML